MSGLVHCGSAVDPHCTLRSIPPTASCYGRSLLLFFYSPRFALLLFFFFLNNPAPPKISPLPLHAPLPLSPQLRRVPSGESARVITLQPDHIGIETFDDMAGQIAWSHHWIAAGGRLVRHSAPYRYVRSEEHTSELQSLAYLVCRLLLEKTKK